MAEGTSDRHDRPDPVWTAKPKRLGQIVLGETRAARKTAVSDGPGNPMIENRLWTAFAASCPSARTFGPVENEVLCLASEIINEFVPKGSDAKPRFLELCCGKGLLTHCLNSDGRFCGRGTDRAVRTEWQRLNKGSSSMFFASELSDSSAFPDVDVIIAVRPRTFISCINAHGY